MKTKLFCILAVATSLFFVSCKDKNAASLDGHWEVSALIKEDIHQEIAESFMDIKNGLNGLEVSGNSGVNFYNGTVKVRGGQIKFSDKFALTKMMGSPAANEFEDLFISTLMNADSYKLEDKTLTVSSSSKKSAVQFVKK